MIIDELTKRDWLLLDGAIGTNLFAAGLEAGEAPELWNISQPQKIWELHQSFVDAGSDVILTNSFGGNRYRLKLHDNENNVRWINQNAAEIARFVADASTTRGRKVIVAGSVGPTGELLEPVGTLTFEDAVKAFREQIDALLAGGVDVIWAETISSREEFLAIVEAARGVPLCATLSFDTAGRTMMGVTSTEYAELASSKSLVAFGANCGTGPADLLRTVLGFKSVAPTANLIAKANAGIPQYVDGNIEYDGTPELMAEYACMALDAGAKLIGGCCGTTPKHIKAMRKALDNHVKGEPPTLELIRSRIGEFTSTDDGTEAKNEKIRQRRRNKA